MNDQENLPPAGWYDDKTGRKRWWTGRKWGKLAPEHQTRTCKRCGQEGPVLGKKCPTCGKSYKDRTQLKLWGGIAALGVLLLIGFVVMVKQEWENFKDEIRNESISRSQFQGIKIGSTESEVRKALKVDPSSEFEDEREECLDYNKSEDVWGTYSFCFEDGILRYKQQW